VGLSCLLSDDVLQHTDTPRLTQQLHSGRYSESQILRQLKLSIHTDDCVCMYIQHKSVEIQTPTQ